MYTRIMSCFCQWKSIDKKKILGNTQTVWKKIISASSICVKTISDLLLLYGGFALRKVMLAPNFKRTHCHKWIWIYILHKTQFCCSLFFNALHLPIFLFQLAVSYFFFHTTLQNLQPKKIKEFFFIALSDDALRVKNNKHSPRLFVVSFNDPAKEIEHWEFCIFMSLFVLCQKINIYLCLIINKQLIFNAFQITTKIDRF